MEEFLRKIGITNHVSKSSDGCGVIDFESDTEWSVAYSLLEKSDLVEEDDETSNVTYDSSTIQYIGDDYTITLLGDLDQDKYRLVIREND